MEVEELIRMTARKHGVPEDLAVRVAFQESRFNQGAVSPKGAIGVMQLMPGTAQDLGVNPRDLRQNIDGGVRYLGQQLKTFGDERLALAAYNAGPGAVQKYGGVPPFRETQDYVRKISGGGDVQAVSGADIFGMGPTGGRGAASGAAGVSGADIFGMGGGAAPGGAQPPPGRTPPPGVLPPQGRPGSARNPIEWTPQNARSIQPLEYFRYNGKVYQQQKGAPAPGAEPARVSPLANTPAGRIRAGLTSERAQPRARESQTLGFVKELTDPYARWMGRNEATQEKLPDSVRGAMSLTSMFNPIGMLKPLGVEAVNRGQEFVRERMAAGETPGGVGGVIGGVAATLPAWAIGNPWLAGAMSGGITSKAEDLPGLARDVGFGTIAGGAADKAARVVSPVVGKVLQGKPNAKIVMGKDGMLTSPLLVDAVTKKKALYDAVEAQGFQFDPMDVVDTAAKFGAKVREEGGPKAAGLIPAAESFAAKFEALALSPDGVSLTRLDKLRSQIFDDLILKGGSEARLGYAAREMIDDLMDRAGAPLIREARKANTVYEKINDVVERVASGRLAAGRANSGQNVVNAARQKLSPTIDPKHGDFVRNYTPDERMQVDKIVNGDFVANRLRDLSNIGRNRFLQVGAALLGSGATVNPVTGAGAAGALELLGQGARKGAERYTRGKIDDLLRIMSAEGSKAAASRVKAPNAASRTAQAAVKAKAKAAPVAVVTGYPLSVEAANRRRNAGQTRR